jgi:hypothetical protein
MATGEWRVMEAFKVSVEKCIYCTGIVNVVANDADSAIEQVERMIEMVINLSVDQIRNTLCDRELIGKLGLTQKQVERVFESLPE